MLDLFQASAAFGGLPQEMQMLKLLNFFRLLVTETVENDRETGAKRGPWFPGATWHERFGWW